MPAPRTQKEVSLAGELFSEFGLGSPVDSSSPANPEDKESAAAPKPPPAPPKKSVAPSADGRSQKELMLAGELYYAFDGQLDKEREIQQALKDQYNAIPPTDHARRTPVAKRLFGSIHEDAPPHIEPTFRCDYGSNIHFGRHFYANFDCCILDCNEVVIGDNVFFAPNVAIYTPGHPLDPALRGNYLKGLEFAKPIRIGDNVWIGGGAKVLPGVTIGSNVTVGAGSVVTRDVPDDVVVAGNPARVIRRLGPGGGPGGEAVRRHRRCVVM